MIRFVAAIAALCLAPLVLAAAPTAEISGTVVAAATGAPVRGAMVVLACDDGDVTLTNATDELGRFSFGRLEAGTYDVSVTQPGYLDVRYGQTRPGSGSPGASLQLADGQRIQHLALGMPRGGAIIGIVHDAYGAPAFGAIVTAERSVWTSSGLTLVASDGVRSDDRGMYRIPVLPPGDYVVRAEDADGTNRSAAFHPAVALRAAAATVTLDLSQERDGIDITLQPLASHDIRGSVVDAGGEAPSRPLAIALTDAATGILVGGAGAQLDQGRFALPRVSPGRYLLTAIAGTGVEPWLPTATALHTPARHDGPTLWAQNDITVFDQDVTDIRLVLQAGVTLSGRVVAEDGGPSVDVSTRHVEVIPAVPTPLWRAILPAPIDARGRFVIDNVPPGRYRVSLDAAEAGVVLRSAVAGGRDIFDLPLEVQPNASITTIALTVTDRAASITGTLLAPTGLPASDVTVVVFPAESESWVPPFRRLFTMRPGADGRFAFRALVAGDYRLAALAGVEQGRWFDARFLAEVVRGAISIRLADGEQRTVNLRTPR